MTAAEQDYLLGLDISTFCCGFCIWNLSENKFEIAGHIPLKKYNNWLDKVDQVCYIIEEIKDNTNSIKHVVIEDIITKFISGKSNIKTIIKLAGFNHVIQRKCTRFLEWNLLYLMLFVPAIWPSVRVPEEATPKNTFSKE